MRNILDISGVAYSHVTLQSVHAFQGQTTVTFRVDLVKRQQLETFNNFNFFLNSPTFHSFSNYTVINTGRGLVDITRVGMFLCVNLVNN